MGDRGDSGHMGNRGDRGHTGDRRTQEATGATGLNKSTVLRYEIKPKIREINNR